MITLTLFDFDLAMVRIMNAFVLKFEVCRKIVIGIAVYMVDYFKITKRSFEQTRYYISVFRNITVRSRVLMIRFVDMNIALYKTFAFITGVVFSRLKHNIRKALFRAYGIRRVFKATRVAIYNLAAVAALGFYHICNYTSYMEQSQEWPN